LVRLFREILFDALVDFFSEDVVAVAFTETVAFVAFEFEFEFEVVFEVVFVFGFLSVESSTIRLVVPQVDPLTLV
jgi:hypothetical protein